MSSFSHGPLVNSRRERAPAPTTSTHACRTATQWQGRAYPTSRCPRRPPAGSVLPPIPRPHLRTGASALLPAPHKRRRPRPSVHAYLLQRYSLLLSAFPPARLAHAVAPTRANRPPSSRRPQCGGGPAAPCLRHPLAHPGLLHHRLQLGPPAPCSPFPAGLGQRWPTPPSPGPSWPGGQRPVRPPARGDPRAAPH